MISFVLTIWDSSERTDLLYKLVLRQLCVQALPRLNCIREVTL